MKGSNTAFTPDANMLAAFTGKGVPNLVSPDYAATLTVDPAAAQFQQFILTGNATLNALNAGKPGQELVIEIAASGGTRTATFGTNFRESGNAAPTIGTSIVVAFRSNGVAWMEYARSVSALA